MTDQRRALFKRIIWGDYRLTPDDVEKILKESSRYKTMIYRKILMSERWYNIIEILSNEELKEALSEEVISTIHIKSLKENYRNARRILFETALPVAR